MREKRLRDCRLIAVALTLSVLIIASTVHIGTAIPIWEDDDFSDGWQMNAAMNVTDGMLRYIGPSWGRAFHNSSINVGTWKFDLIEFDSESQYADVIFLGTVNRDTLILIDCYFVSLERYTTSMKYVLYKGFDIQTRDPVELANYIGPPTDPTIHHIEVSREPIRGQITVKVNDTIVMQEDGGLPEDDPFGSEPVFYFFASRDVALDNVEVDDEYPSTTTTTPTTLTTTSGPFDWPTIVIIAASAVVIVAVLVIILRRR